MQLTAKRWDARFIQDVSVQFGINWENLGKSTLSSTYYPTFVARTSFEPLSGDSHYQLTVSASLVGYNVIGSWLFHALMILDACIFRRMSTPTTAPSEGYDISTVALHTVTQVVFFTGPVHKSDFNGARFNNNIAVLFAELIGFEKDTAAVWVSSTRAVRKKTSRLLRKLQYSFTKRYHSVYWKILSLGSCALSADSVFKICAPLKINFLLWGRLYQTMDSKDIVAACCRHPSCLFYFMTIKSINQN